MFNAMLLCLISWFNIDLNSFKKVESCSDMLDGFRFCVSIREYGVCYFLEFGLGVDLGVKGGNWLLLLMLMFVLCDWVKFRLG
jgi:hypothetical protein